ncbi:MAG: rhamnan synthesis F family protein [Clostridiales Family XIII bacterium]|nr:rhamnan synthesis F family protein [Clostridiales Family XIII bacterium]
MVEDNYSNYKRACVFVFYDEDGIADQCIDYYLNALSSVTSRIVIVVNGYIDENARSMFLQYTEELIERDNMGYDVCAWREGLYYIGFEQLKEYDELILANDSVFGPIYPLEELFGEMSPRNLGFWGVTKYEKDEDFTKRCTYGYIPEHIQSYFTVFSNALAGSIEFKEFWETLDDISELNDAIGSYEIVLTKHFSDMGYTFGVYADIEEDISDAKNSTIFMPLTLIKKYRSPFLKAKVFVTDQHFRGKDDEITNIPEFIMKSTEYDIGLIYAKVLRKYEQYKLFSTLDLTYVLPSKMQLSTEHHLTSALIMHCYYMDKFEEDMMIASLVPKDIPVYIVTNTLEKSKLLERAASNLAKTNNVEIRVFPDSRCPEAALIVGMKDVVESYDLICFHKEIKTVHDYEPTLVKGWYDKITKSLLSSNTHVNNIISTFENNIYLGILSPAPPITGAMLGVVGNANWTEKDIDKVLKLASVLGLKTKITAKNPSIFPFGGSFWFRTKALKKLFSYEYDFENFPDNTILYDLATPHVIEKIYPFIAQDAGYFPGYVYTDEYATLELATYQFYLRELNQWVSKRGISKYNYKTLQYEMDELIATQIIALEEKQRAIERLQVESLDEKQSLERQNLEIQEELNAFKLKVNGSRIIRFFSKIRGWNIT